WRCDRFDARRAQSPLKFQTEWRTTLAAVPQFDNELYWITYQDNEPPAQVREHLLQPDNYAFYIKGYDADGFFVKLAQQLECFPPGWCCNSVVSII
ncbi:hypothetical protein, partial [Candidatus Thiosymbion oneisti]|uniref:hypothetical protein n=1 Tax=Candidatus Thiosymbion oneisti TaxID=589554 RepID=UPI001C401A59